MAKVRTPQTRDKEYRLCDGSTPAAYFVRNDGNIMVNDKDYKNPDGSTGKQRYMIKAVGMPSIWKDDLKDYGTLTREEVSFESNEGRLIVKGYDELMMEFMDRHPDNKANGGLAFEEYNAVAIVQNKMKEKDLLDKARDEFKNLKATAPEKLKTIAQAKGYSTEGRETIEWMFEIREFAESNPQGFLDSIHDPLVECTSMVNEGISTGILNNDDPSVVRWGNSRQTILNVPQGRDPVESLAEYINSREDGAKATKAELAKQLKENK